MAFVAMTFSAYANHGGGGHPGGGGGFHPGGGGGGGFHGPVFHPGPVVHPDFHGPVFHPWGPGFHPEWYHTQRQWSPQYQVWYWVSPDCPYYDPNNPACEAWQGSSAPAGVFDQGGSVQPQVPVAPPVVVPPPVYYPPPPPVYYPPERPYYPYPYYRPDCGFGPLRWPCV